MLAPGALLQNRYRVIRRIGHGGMGAVYEARHEELGHTVALKETFHTDDEMLRKAFKREARLLAGLRHSSLPRVNDYFTEGDGLFLVMEYVSGEDLGELLKRRGKAFPLKEVLDWAGQLLDVLNYLHTYDPPIIHRDIKPDNIKLTSEGSIMLVDFGLAKGAIGVSTSVVASSSVSGFTPYYAPLEQIVKADPNRVEYLSVVDAAKFEQVLEVGTDARSDLYSIGTTIYHLLTCTLPVQAPMRAFAVWSGQPDPLRPVSELNSVIPPNVSAVLMQALALNVEERPATAIEMSRMLREAYQSPEQRKNDVGATIELPPTVVDLPATLVDVEPAAHDNHSPHFAFNVPTQIIDQPLDVGYQDGAVSAPDTQDISVAATQKQPAKSFGAGQRRRRWGRRFGNVVAALALFTGIVILGNLIAIAYLNWGGKAYTYQGWQFRGSVPVKTGIETVSFTPDGKLLAVGTVNGELKLWNAQTGASERELTGQKGSITSASFSPDSKMLATGGIDSRIRLWDVQSGFLRRTVSGSVAQTSYVAFSTDGKTLASAGNDNKVKLWDVQSGSLRSILLGHKGSVRAVAFSPDGKKLASGGEDTVMVWNAQTGEAQQTLSDKGDTYTYSVAFSPDSRTVASGHSKVIKLWNPETGELKRTIQVADALIKAIAFSPDGKTLVSGSLSYYPGAIDGIKLWDVETGELKHTFSPVDSNVNSIAISPDGRMLISGNNDGKVRLWEYMPAALNYSALAAMEKNWFSILLIISAATGLTIVALKWRRKALKRKRNLPSR